MSETAHLKIGADSDASDADNLQYIQGFVEGLGEREAWPESLTFKVNLVLFPDSFVDVGKLPLTLDS